jgi:hypothetical protein
VGFARHQGTCLVIPESTVTVMANSFPYFTFAQPHDDKDMLCTGLANAIASVPTTGRPWNERIILAVWKVSYPSCHPSPGTPSVLS